MVRVRVADMHMHALSKLTQWLGLGLGLGLGLRLGLGLGSGLGLREVRPDFGLPLGTIPCVLKRRRERIGVGKIVVSAVLTVVAGKHKTTTIALNYAPAAHDVVVADVPQHGENVGGSRRYCNPKPPVRDRVGEWQLVEVQTILSRHDGNAAKHDRLVEAFAGHTVADRFYAECGS